MSSDRSSLEFIIKHYKDDPGVYYLQSVLIYGRNPIVDIIVDTKEEAKKAACDISKLFGFGYRIVEEIEYDE